MYLEFLSVIEKQVVRLWSLHSDGKGNLGGNSIYWDTNGSVTVNGTLYSGSGQIGGFELYQNYMEAKTAISRSFYIRHIAGDPTTTYQIDDGGLTNPRQT
jgi:hypothetical protein